MKTCDVCGRRFVYDRGKRTTKKTCRMCHVNRHRWTLKWWAMQARGGRCQLCGYDSCQRSLDFHHVDPAEKDFTFGGKHGWPWEKLRAELQKTVLLCCRCHGEVHAVIDDMVYGCGDETGVLARMDELVAAPLVEMPKYSRRYWKLAHPKYRTAYAPVPDVGSPEFATFLAKLTHESHEAARRALRDGYPDRATPEAREKPFSLWVQVRKVPPVKADEVPLI